MHDPKKIHKNMRNRRIARQALLQAYRAHPMNSGARIVNAALRRISSAVKKGTSRYSNLNIALLPASNVKTLVKQHGISKSHAEKIRNGVLSKHFNDVMKFKL